jgi:hypothetical protein
MDIKFLKIILVIAGFLLLSLHCRKRNESCPKEGYEYINTTSHCWYNPDIDSIPVGGVIILSASIPKTFVDEISNSIVTNTSDIVEGPFGVVMLNPTYRAAIDDFELSAEIGKIIKDTINFSSGMLKGFRTIRWDASSPDSFKMKITIKPLVKGIYDMALKQQGAKDKDCALYKYFLKVASDQHLHYWAEFNNGVIDDYARNYAYCFKVY